MYMAIRRYRLPKERLNDVVNKTKNEGLPIFEKIPGFVDYYYLYSDGFVTVVNTYESRESAERSSRIAAEWVQENIPGAYAGPPEIISGEILFHRHNKVSAAA